MRERRLILGSLGCFALAALALLLADTSAVPDDELRRYCSDWWCAPRNTLLVGLGVFLAGIAVLLVGIALNGPSDDDDRPPHAPELGRRPRARSHR